MLSFCFLLRETKGSAPSQLLFLTCPIDHCWEGNGMGVCPPHINGPWLTPVLQLLAQALASLEMSISQESHQETRIYARKFSGGGVIKGVNYKGFRNADTANRTMKQSEFRCRGAVGHRVFPAFHSFGSRSWRLALQNRLSQLEPVSQ